MNKKVNEIKMRKIEYKLKEVLIFQQIKYYI